MVQQVLAAVGIPLLSSSHTLLYMKLHNYHWYVSGPQPFTLHEKFEPLYKEAATRINELEERVLALISRAVAPLSVCLQLAEVSAAVGGETADHMLQTLMNDFSALLTKRRGGMKTARDEGTANMPIGHPQAVRAAPADAVGLSPLRQATIEGMWHTAVPPYPRFYTDIR